MKRGSALLIVLGMLSFMLFSGLAFSIYMRQARLPSSFIRRTAMTRQLAKAALAEAMAEINDCIGNDPHPGVFDPGVVKQQSSASSKSSTYNYNTFYRRIFLGAGADKGLYSANRDNALRRLLTDNMSDDPSDTTVATLTLEGLAYLPPCLVNEARVYSRRTPTAKWAPFAFEAGRYAYTAIDVSDYFDLNRVPVNAHRSSASGTRITLAHAFENADHTASGGSAAKTCASQATGRQAQRYPFISLCDWNLAMGSTKLGEYSSPVMDYIRRADSEPCPITASDDETDRKVSAYRAMTFVTDSLFTPDASGKKDIDDQQYQPFEKAELKKNATQSLYNFMTSYSEKTAWKDHYLKFLSRLGMCMLCDYLDEDSVPLSLTIPSCEKIPMLCAIRPNVSELKLKIVKSGNPENEAELLGAGGSGKPDSRPEITERTVSCWFAYEIDGSGLNCRAAGIEAMALFPFLRNEDAVNYTVDGQVALYFTKSGEDIPLVNSALNAKGLVMNREPEASFDAGVLKLKVGSSAIQISGNGKSTDAETKFVKSGADLQITGFSSVSGSLPMNKNATADASKSCVLKVLRQWKQHRQKKDDGTMGEWDNPTPPENAEIVKAENGFGVLDNKGNLRSDILAMATNGAELELNLALWLRIKENGGRGKAVDMVPAWMNDDSSQGLSGASGSRTAAVYQMIGGATMRLMRFKFKANGDTKVLSLAPKALDSAGEKTLTLDAPTLVCSDPRYNHNPCNWFRTSETDVKQAWESNVNCTGDGRDGDYHMFVSNQGYLQSIYELAFLPRLTNPPVTDSLAGELTAQNNYGYPTDYPEGFANCIDAKLMWRTYRPFSTGNGSDDFEALELTSGANGQKVNPFSDSPMVIAAAFANTPVDWRAAATNYQNAASIGTSYKADQVDAFNEDYAWNEYNSEAKLPWFDGVMTLAEKFQGAMRTCSEIDEWEDVYGSLWDGTGTGEKNLMGLEIPEGNFTSVDKKFLYGYWHDCFGVQQQLFLVFVRAEPMMMGGGVSGAAPPQLASRAVALVWRDPRPTVKDGTTSKPKPHAMRVLFYHPLE